MPAIGIEQELAAVVGDGERVVVRHRLVHVELGGPAERAGEVDPVRHLIGTAFGWGGLPESEAFYLVEPAPHPPTHHRITFRDVPVDGFWSITIYNEDGFLEANPFDAYSLNGVTSLADDDGSVTIDLSPTNDGFRNHLYVMDGWNYAIRLYRPRPEVLDSTWHAPIPIPVD